VIASSDDEFIKTVFLENCYVFLLVVHLLATFVLIGSMSHNLLGVVAYCRGRFERQALEKRNARVFFGSYVVVYVIGCVIYPAYRVYIRQYFDPQLPWATGLFEVKEHWGALATAMVLVYYLLRKQFQPSEDRSKLALYVPLCFLLNFIVWYKVIVGIWLTILKGSWL